MGVFSGKYGVVNTFGSVRNWVLSETTTPAEARLSNTKGGTLREEGVYDYTGTCEGIGGTPPALPSEYFDFLGFTAPTTGAWGTTGITHSADNAIVDEVTINWNWKTGELLDWTMSFSAGEPLAITSGTGTTTDTASIATPRIVCGTKVTLTTANTTWPNIVSASLTITANNPSYVNSSTSGKTGRRPGIIDWTAAITEETTGPFASLAAATCLGTEVGGNNTLRLWVDSTDYWDLDGAHLVDMSDLRVDMDTGDIVAQTNNFAMSALDSANLIGRIGKPGDSGTYWWPDNIAADTLPF